MGLPGPRPGMKDHSLRNTTPDIVTLVVTVLIILAIFTACLWYSVRERGREATVSTGVDLESAEHGREEDNVQIVRIEGDVLSQEPDVKTFEHH